MKKIIICLLAISFIAFASCGKDDETTPTETPTANNNQNPPVDPPDNPPSLADDFVGDYMLDGTLNINLMTTTFNRDFENIPLTIEKNGNSGDVNIIINNNTYEGYVNNSGLHIDPIMISIPVEGNSYSFTATIPVVSKPVNGQTSCQVGLSASVPSAGQTINITGTADVTATMVGSK